MDAVSLIGLCVVAALASFTVARYDPQIAIHIALAGGAVVLLAVIAQLSGLVNELNEIASESGASPALVSVVIKAVGIAYLARLASELCRDMGEGALAVKTEIVGRVMLLALALPLIRSIAEMLIELIRSSL